MKVADLSKILQSICKRPANALCADCSNKNPTWVSIDFGVMICLNCSGAHRALGPSITRVRSTSLDQWQQAWIEFLSEGNIKINEFLEYNLNKNKKPCSNSSQEYINGFVHDKYVKRRYVNPGVTDPMAVRNGGGDGNKIQKMETKNQKKQSSKSKQVSFERERNDDEIQKIFKTNANLRGDSHDFIKAATSFKSYNPKQKESKRQIYSLKVLTNTIKQSNKKDKQKQKDKGNDNEKEKQKIKKEADFQFDFQKAKAKKQVSVDSFNNFAFTKSQSLNCDSVMNKFADFGIVKEGKKSKELQNCEEQQCMSDKKQKQYTFDDVFSQTVPPSKPAKTYKHFDPFGILL